MPEACSFYLLNGHWALVPAGFETYLAPCFIGTSSAGMSAGGADKKCLPRSQRAGTSRIAQPPPGASFSLRTVFASTRRFSRTLSFGWAAALGPSA